VFQIEEYVKKFMDINAIRNKNKEVFLNAKESLLEIIAEIKNKYIPGNNPTEQFRNTSSRIPINITTGIGISSPNTIIIKIGMIVKGRK
jgi:hypothetical protein